MGHKVFQDFAHVLCQKFVDLPSNRDLVNLAILGSGKLTLLVTEGRASHNGIAIQPLPYAELWLAWVKDRMRTLRIAETELTRAQLVADCRVELERQPGTGFLCVKLALACEGTVSAPDRVYSATYQGEKRWGLSIV